MLAFVSHLLQHLQPKGCLILLSFLLKLQEADTIDQFWGFGRKALMKVRLLMKQYHKDDGPFPEILYARQNQQYRYILCFVF